ncbi:hypothetical protein CEXT_381081 [Caerostris extrusa]|uniref:Uncharacterized protein n=1 Tax=Caerostris extrusa TaxID=172846 RepID=A0AAV4SJR4_CAEEX|nr:hypothetical protein CEXT_381081 [Caerostris extrusa]
MRNFQISIQIHFHAPPKLHILEIFTSKTESFSRTFEWPGPWMIEQTWKERKDIASRESLSPVGTMSMLTDNVLVWERQSGRPKYANG